MSFSILLSDVRLKQVVRTQKVAEPLFDDGQWQISQNEFAMQVEGVGSFYAGNGYSVEYSPDRRADNEIINLYLNGQILVALLHQRKIINFHASSFIFASRGIMLLGETGAGKSSLTASFTRESGGFLSDDLSPVLIKGKTPYLWPVYKSIKLWPDTIDHLQIDQNKLRPAEKLTGKQIFEVEHEEVADYQLNHIVKVEVGETDELQFHELSNAQKFTFLRSEICFWEILKGMPDTERSYMKQLLKIINHVDLVRIVRPRHFSISALHAALKDYIRNAQP